jgi:quinol monooxygenase YgiN
MIADTHYTDRSDQSVLVHYDRSSMSVNSDVSEPKMIVSTELLVSEKEKQKFLGAALTLATISELEPGCLSFIVSEQMKPNVQNNAGICKWYLFTEIYKTTNAFDDHKRSSHFRAWTTFRSSMAAPFPEHIVVNALSIIDSRSIQ